jgi:hypothetical protein
VKELKPNTLALENKKKALYCKVREEQKDLSRRMRMGENYPVQLTTTELLRQNPFMSMYISMLQAKDGSDSKDQNG